MTKTKTLRAAVYIRQSKFSEESVSEEIQRINCTKLANREGYQIVAEYKDIDISGGSTKGRDGLAELRQAYSEDQFDIAIADDLDRFARDTADSSIIRAEMPTATWKEGKQDNELYADIQSAFGADVLRKIRARWDDALLLRLSKGLPPSGKRQFGYDKVDATGKINPDPKANRHGYIKNKKEAKILKEAYERYTAGEGARLICEDFTKRGLASAGPAGWHPSGFFDLLDKPFYAGKIVWTWNETKTVNGEKVRVLKEVLEVKGAHKPILKPAEWAAYRKAREDRKTHMQPRNPKWFASGIVRCGLCESVMVSHRDGRGRDNLTCSLYNAKGRSACVGVFRKRSVVSMKINRWLNTHYEEWAAGMPTNDEARIAADKALADAVQAVSDAEADYSKYSQWAYENDILPKESSAQLKLKKDAIAAAERDRDEALAVIGNLSPTTDTGEQIREGLLLLGFTEGEHDEPSPEATARFRQVLSNIIEKVLVMPISTDNPRDPKRNVYSEIEIFPVERKVTKTG